MEAEAKKTTLRMIPYGIYVLTADDGANVAAATVNWVTQTSFNPPLIAVGVLAFSVAAEAACMRSPTSARSWRRSPRSAEP